MKILLPVDGTELSLQEVRVALRPALALLQQAAIHCETVVVSGSVAQTLLHEAHLLYLHGD